MPRTIDWGEGPYGRGNCCEYDNQRWRSGYGYWILWETDLNNGGVRRRKHWYCSIECRNLDAECCDCNQEDDYSEEDDNNYYGSDDGYDRYYNDDNDDEEEEDEDEADCVCQEMMDEDED